jgi:UDP-glucose 4-epimerase
MEVTVIGGHGGIGRFVVAELVTRGHTVSVFDLEDDGGFREEYDYSYVSGDVTEGSSVVDALKGQDAVVHLAALKRPACRENPKLAQEVNVGGSVNVFDAAAELDIRVIHVSSKAIFGHISGRYAYPVYEPLGEEAPRNPVGNVYGLTKMASESYRQVFEDKYDIDAASFRFGSSFGPGKVAFEGKGLLIPDAIEAALRGGTVTLPGGDEKNDMIYFGDIAVGLADAVEASTLNYSTYHLGSGELTSMYDFAEVLREECPDADIRVKSGRNPQNKDHPHYALMDISRARSDFNYEPRHGFAGGIRSYMERLEERE